jgi:hypothetical protein
LIVKQIYSPKDIKAVLCHPEIYDCITGDECPVAEVFEPPVDDNHAYIGGYVNGVIVAIMVYHKYLDGDACHVQVLPEYRKQYAKSFGQQSLLFRRTAPLYAEIPDLYGNVLNFAILNGFAVIDIVVDSYIKNGEKHNMNILEYNDGVC